MPKIFRTLPPLDLVEQVFKTFTLTGLTDSTWFSKSMLNIQELERLLPELEPYYMPCKAKDFIHEPLTQARGLTILRQLCKAHAISFTAAERTCAGVKGMWYQITPTEPKSITIEFH
jgi:hypothetical protein